MHINSDLEEITEGTQYGLPNECYYYGCILQQSHVRSTRGTWGEWPHVRDELGKVSGWVAFSKNEFTTQWKGQKDISGRGNNKCKGRGTNRASRGEITGCGQKNMVYKEERQKNLGKQTSQTLKGPRERISTWTWSSRHEYVCRSLHVS